MIKLLYKKAIVTLMMGLGYLSFTNGLWAMESVPLNEPIVAASDIANKLPPSWSKDGLYIFPEAGRTPWLEAFKYAKHKIQMAAYRLSDPEILQALCTAAKRVKVELLIEKDTFKHERSQNITSGFGMLKAAGIKFAHAPAQFNQIHCKTAIIDDTWAVIGTGNLDAESLDGSPDGKEAPTRDFIFTITKPTLVAEMQRVFTADFNEKRVVPADLPELVWGPDQQRTIFLKMINGAKQSIRVYQQALQDEGITKALAAAARDGVKVEVLMMPFPFGGKEDANAPNQELIRRNGGTVYLHTQHYIHAKAMIVDAASATDRQMYLGSCNFYAPSIDQTRELGVLIRDAQLIKRVNDTFDQDALKTAVPIKK